MSTTAKMLDRIDAIAESDRIYQIWYKSRQEFEDAFRKFVACQPPEVSNMLWGYAGSGEMMLQRKLLLVCENIEFVRRVNDEEKMLRFFQKIRDFFIRNKGHG